MARHIHADLIIAWANGAIIQYQSRGGGWQTCGTPMWGEKEQYRIKPKAKVKMYRWAFKHAVTGESDVSGRYYANESELLKTGNVDSCVRLDWTVQEREGD